jgi:hypothetical protein
MEPEYPVSVIEIHHASVGLRLALELVEEEGLDIQCTGSA